MKEDNKFINISKYKYKPLPKELSEKYKEALQEEENENALALQSF